MKASVSNSISKSVLVGGAVLAVAGAAGCSTTREINRDMATGQQQIQSIAQQANVTHDPMVNNGVFQVVDGFHAARTPIQRNDLGLRDRLPEQFSRDASLSYLSSMSLGELAHHINKVSGYRTVIETELTDASLSRGIQYKGTLTGLLDQVASEVGGSWRWSGNTITFYKFETRTFRLDFLAGSTESSATLSTSASNSGSGGGGGGGGGGGESGTTGSSGQDVSMSSTFDVWSDISEVIKNSLSSGGVFSVAPSSGVLTVRDTPQVLRVVEAQVREFNRIYSSQVLLDIHVYAIERTRDEGMAMDWTVAWQNAARRYNLGWSSNGAGGAVNGGAAPGLSGVINSGPFADSGALFQALSSLGHTKLVTSGTVSSLNGQTVPMNIAREVAYLQSYATTLASGTGGTSTTTLTPGVVTDGFSFNFTPRILQDNRVLLRYSVDLASIDAIETFEAPDGNSAIQLPRRSVRNFMQNVSMRSGQSLVLTGFQQANTNTSTKGPFSSKAWLLGGGKQADETLRTIVIVVTPRIVE